MNKYCRICWNTLNWRRPSGDARGLELGDSYVADNGFGHEEWLFNFEWLLPSPDPSDPHEYRYGFLQPISKYRQTYAGNTFDALLYTVDPAQVTLAVAKIANLYVPLLEELDWVLQRVKRNGWLELMRQDVRDVGASQTPLQNPNASSIANIRFLQEDVTFFHPMLAIPTPHKTTTIHRYQPLDWDDGYDPTPPLTMVDVSSPSPDGQDAPDRSEGQRTRGSQTGTTYDPQHAILQNRLRRWLQNRYGADAVRMEADFVDLRFVHSGTTTFVEIKMDRSVKGCIRSAFGQLLEYAHYPNQKKADVLLVVGDASPSQQDALYLRYLRETYTIPVYYARWAWSREELEDQI